MRGFKTGYVAANTEEYALQEQRIREERVAQYAARIAAGLDVFDEDTEDSKPRSDKVDLR